MIFNPTTPIVCDQHATNAVIMYFVVKHQYPVAKLLRPYNIHSDKATSALPLDESTKGTIPMLHTVNVSATPTNHPPYVTTFL